MTRVRTLFAPLLALFLLLAAAPARAAETAAAPTTGDLEALVSTIEDTAAREKLVTQLKALIAAQKPAATPDADEDIGAGIVSAMSRRLARASQSVAAAADLLRDMPKISRWVDQQTSDPAAVARWKAVIFHLIAALVAGYACEKISRLLLSRPRRRLVPSGEEGMLQRGVLLAVGMLLDLLPLAAFAGGAYGVVAGLEPPRVARVVTITVTNAYLLSRLAIGIATWLLQPPETSTRHRRLKDETAQYLVIWVRRFVLVLAVGWFLSEALRALGLPYAGYIALLKILGLVVLAMTIVLILQVRGNVAAAIAAEDRDPPPRFANLRRRLADIWHPLAIIYAVALYSIWALEVEGGFPFMLRGTLVTLLATALASAANFAIRQLSGRLFAIGDDVRVRFPGLEARANLYLPILQNVLHGVVWFAAALAILTAWGADIATWVQDGFGRRVLQAAFTIGIVTVLAVVCWEGVSAAIERYMTKTDAAGNRLTRSSRARSLLPVLRNLVFVVLAAMVVLIALSELGVNIAPLLAGAGVAGLAIGFGAQTLVKDVITGAFILFEDSVAVGDIVKVGNFAGLVESLSIRSIRLRDFNGNVYTVPFSSVTEITNMTKDYSYYAFDLQVAYREDTDNVTKVLQEIGAEMQADANFGYMIMEPMEVVGVDAFKDSSVVIKARIKTAPIRQWTVGRELNRRIKKRFDELGIELPYPHVTLYFGENKQGDAPPMRVELRQPPAAS